MSMISLPSGDATEVTLSDVDLNTDGLEALSAAANALLTTINAAVADLDTNTDGIESLISASNALLTTINASTSDIDLNTDTLEALIAAGNILLADIDTNTDGIEALIGTTNTALGAIAGGSSAFQAAVLAIMQPSTSFTAPQAFTVTTIAQQLPNMVAPRAVTVQCVTGSNVYVGASNAVTSTTGFAVPSGSTVTIPVSNANLLWVIKSGAGTSDARIMVA